MTARIVQIIVVLAGLCALVLGLLIWITNIDLTDIHILFGLLVTLGPAAMSIMALTASGLRIWGMVGIGRHHSVDLWPDALQPARRKSALADPDAAHAGRHRRDRADGRSRRALQDAEARPGAARGFISSAALGSFRFRQRSSRATRGPIHVCAVCRAQRSTKGKTTQHVLVTGGAGRLGRLVVKHLGAAGYPVRGMSRRANPGEDWPGAEWKQADLVTGAGLSRVVEGMDAVVHTV